MDMPLGFEGVRWIEPDRLYVSQLYVNETKLLSVQSWLTPASQQHCEPLPVYDFGDGNFTLTDGHTRALVFLLQGLPCPVRYDDDDIVTGPEGLKAYRTAIGWCRDAGVCTVADLCDRIIKETQYQTLWLERCRRAFAAME